MHHLDLILTLTGGLAAALVCGYLTHRLGLSPSGGYFLGGFGFGPFTPGFVANRALAEQLAEVGIILLMFGVGLQFHLKELLAVRRVALPGAIVQSTLATVLGAVAARAFGWSWAAGIVFGLALSVASTVVLVRVLTDNSDLHTPTGHIAVGWLVVEDLFTVLVLVLLPALVGSQQAGLSHVPLALGLGMLKVATLVAGTFLVGGRLIPWLLERVAATHSRELFTLTVLVLALGIAMGSATLFGVSMALGAFLAGMVVGTLGVILLGKPLAALGIVLLLRYPFRVALAVAVALAQIGEFSFILAILGKELGLLTDAAMHTVVATAIISITLNPLLYRLIDPVAAWVGPQPRLWGWLTTRTHTLPPPEA